MRQPCIYYTYTCFTTLYYIKNPTGRLTADNQPWKVARKSATTKVEPPTNTVSSSLA